MQATLYRDESGFDALADEWDALLHDSQTDTLFMTHMWQTTWWRHLGEGELLILAVRDENGLLVGVAPLYGLPHAGSVVYHTVGCVDVSDYLDWIVRQGQEERVLASILDSLADEMAEPGHVLELCNVPDGSPTLELLPSLAEERGFQVVHAIEDVVPLFRLPDSWEAYEQMLQGKARRELRRKLRKVGPYSGVDWYVVGPDHDLPSEIDAFIELLIKSHPEKADFMDDRNRAFFHAVGRATYDRGYLQLAFLTANAKRVAAYMNFVYGGRLLVYNSGLDPAAYRLSAGIVLMAFLIRQAIEHGEFEILDFLRGDEAYKYQLGGTDTHVHRLTLARA
jgi:CelD/BcsL family acetyltransferase involved in cellulose biosynthesis